MEDDFQTLLAEREASNELLRRFNHKMQDMADMISDYHGQADHATLTGIQACLTMFWDHTERTLEQRSEELQRYIGHAANLR